MRKNVRGIKRNSILFCGRAFCFLAFIIGVFCLFPLQAKAQVVYENENGYQAIIEDDWGILAENEISKLVDTLKPITEYGNATIIIRSEFEDGARMYAEEYVDVQYGGESGTVMLIDPRKNRLEIQNSGYIHEHIDANRCLDLIFEYDDYVESEKYFTCFVMVLNKMSVILADDEVAGPIKSVCYVLLALITAMVVMYLVVDSSMKKHVVSEDEWLESISAKQDIYNFSEHYLHENKKYVPGSSKYQKKIDGLD